MKLLVLGSGGALPTPRPFCVCQTCRNARKLGEPYKRNSSSLFIPDINALIDCGEDIGDSLARRNVKKVDHLFITHWHPDHTFGLRVVLESGFNFKREKADRVIDVYMPKNVFQILKKRFPAVTYYLDVLKTGRLHFIGDGAKIKIKGMSITAVGYNGKKSDNYAYLLESKGKRVLYAPCDTLKFVRCSRFIGLDLLINECGLFSKSSSEISFGDLMKRIKAMGAKKTILTHIEEDEVKEYGRGHFKKMKKIYPDINFDFADDGLEILV